jgi:hypothetical protein
VTSGQVNTTALARVVASLLLLAGGFVVAVTAFAIVLARVLVDSGMTVRPSDAALLADLYGILPLIVGFGAVTFIAAVGLLARASWAPAVAFASAFVAVALGGVGVVLIVLGRDPFVPVASPASLADGLGIVAAFTAFYLLVVIALAAARPPRTSITGAAA